MEFISICFDKKNEILIASINGFEQYSIKKITDDNYEVPVHGFIVMTKCPVDSTWKTPDDHEEIHPSFEDACMEVTERLENEFSKNH
jgi:hypothetical protein